MFIEPTITSVIVAKIRKGKFRNLENVHIKGWYLFIISSLIQLILSIKQGMDKNFSLHKEYFTLIHGLSYLFLIIGMALNIKRNSMKLFIIGTILNLIVIFTNGGQMPVSLEGLKGLNNPTIELPLSEFDIKHKSITESTKFIFLADILLIPRPYPLPKILSIGDLFLMAGVFLFIQEAMVGDAKP